MKKTWEESEAESEKIVEHLRQKKLDDFLECELDTMPSKEFGPGASLYHAFVDVVAHRDGDMLRFDVLHPADERDKCPVGKPEGFSVPLDFNPLAVSQKIRRLAREAAAIYEKMGINVREYVDGSSCDY
jgi:hypothetical protein